MGKIYFFRHGKTDENKTGIFCGATDTGINLSGKIEFPEVDVVFCSPLKRCKSYLSIMAEGIKQPVISDKLKEINFGSWEGKTFDDIQNQFPKQASSYLKNPLRFVFPGGESYKAVKKRIKEFIKSDLLDHIKSDEDILIISHEGVIKCLLINLLGLKDDFFLKLKIQNEMFCTIEYFGIFFMLQTINTSSICPDIRF